jgi:hypothetical protein
MQTKEDMVNHLNLDMDMVNPNLDMDMDNLNQDMVNHPNLDIDHLNLGIDHLNLDMDNHPNQDMVNHLNQDMGNLMGILNLNMVREMEGISLLIMGILIKDLLIIISFKGKGQLMHLLQIIKIRILMI